MNTFFKQINQKNEIIYLFSYNDFSPGITNTNIIQITKEEYDLYIKEYEEKALLTDRLYKNEIKILDIPTEWQEEIQENVNSIISRIGEFENLEISSNEFQTMLEEVL